jgi:hypothetical protein
MVCETHQRGSNIDFIECFNALMFSEVLATLTNRSILSRYKRIHLNIRIRCKFGCNANHE